MKSTEGGLFNLIIDRVDTFPLFYKIPTPYGDANGYKRYRSCYLIKITTKDGISGWGECIDWLPTLDKGFKGRIIPFLLGKKVQKSNEIIQVIKKWHSRAACAVSMALLDLLAKSTGVSVCELWGGSIRDRIPVYASFQSYTEDDDWMKRSIEHVERKVRQGFGQIKVKIGGRRVKEDQQHIESLIHSLDKSVMFCLDANQSYDVSTTLSWKAKLLSWQEQGYHFSWLEEPVPLDSFEQYQILRYELGVPIAGGENITGPKKFLSLLSQQALDIVQPDCMHHAGIDEYRQSCHLARTFGFRVSPHSFDGALNTYYAILVQACLPSWSKMQDDEIEPVEWDVMDNPFTSLLSIQPKNGVVHIPSGGGRGVEIDEEKIQSYLWDGTDYL